MPKFTNFAILVSAILAASTAFAGNPQSCVDAKKSLALIPDYQEFLKNEEALYEKQRRMEYFRMDMGLKKAIAAVAMPGSREPLRYFAVMSEETIDLQNKIIKGWHDDIAITHTEASKKDDDEQFKKLEGDKRALLKQAAREYLPKAAELVRYGLIPGTPTQAPLSFEEVNASDSADIAYYTADVDHNPDMMFERFSLYYVPTKGQMVFELCTVRDGASPYSKSTSQCNKSDIFRLSPINEKQSYTPTSFATYANFIAPVDKRKTLLTASNSGTCLNDLTAPKIDTSAITAAAAKASAEADRQMPDHLAKLEQTKKELLEELKKAFEEAAKQEAEEKAKAEATAKKALAAAQKGQKLDPNDPNCQHVMQEAVKTAR